MNIATHMQRAGRTFADRPAVALGATVLWDYAGVADRVARLAGALRTTFKLNAGERVALILANCPQYIELLYACWHAGLVVVPVNAKLHSSDFSYILTNSGARLCFVSPELATVIDALVDKTSVAVVPAEGEHYEQLCSGKPYPLVDCAPHDSAWLFYTSGTTGRPKGAVLSHRNLLAMSLCYFADVDCQGPWTSILHAAPMSHGSGLYALAHVMKGSCHVIAQSKGFDPAEVFALIENWPHLVFFAAPTMVKRLLEHPVQTDTSNLKTIIYGGGPMYVDDLLAAIERFGAKFSQLYGQGESPMTITALNMQQHADKHHPRWLERLASVGIAQSAVQVRVVSDQGETLPDGQVGEIVVAGEAVMTGYWQDENATARTLRNGWLYTGDFGVFDKEGFLTLKGRSKDVIISGGTNIYPREVEDIILTHPQVAEVSVIGCADREWGESVVAYVVAQPEQTVDPATLEQFCIEHMARFKRPKYYRIVESLPKNNYGKVLKTTLREMENSRDG